MRAVIQRVSSASVLADGVETGSIGPGLLVFLGVGSDDQETDASWLALRIPKIRVFPDEAGQMNRSVCDLGGGILVISQFTLLASLRKGTRPSFNHAAPPAQAIPLYRHFLAQLRSAFNGVVAEGVFGAYMEIRACHDGPVTLHLDTRLRNA